MMKFLLPTMVYADDIVTVMQDIAGRVLTIARGIVFPIGIIGIIICGVKIMVATDPQSITSAKRWIFCIIIGIIIVMFAPAILEQLRALSQAGGFTWN